MATTAIGNQDAVGCSLLSGIVGLFIDLGCLNYSAIDNYIAAHKYTVTDKHRRANHYCDDCVNKMLFIGSTELHAFIRNV